MTMTDADVRAALLRASDHVEARPDFLDGVRELGGRRVVHRRAVLGAGLTAVAAGSTLGLGWLRDGPPGPSPAGWSLLSGPPRGDLATDRAFVARLLAQFRRDVSGYDQDETFSGAPVVVWAGRTPAGSAGVVAQPLRPEFLNGPDPGGPRPSGEPVAPSPRSLVEPPGPGPDAATSAAPAPRHKRALVLFYQPTSAGLHWITHEIFAENAPERANRAMVIGPRRDVLVVLDIGAAADYSTEVTYEPDGRLSRRYQPVRFDDGAAILAVPSLYDSRALRLRSRIRGADDGVPFGVQFTLDDDLPPAHSRVIARVLPGVPNGGARDDDTSRPMAVEAAMRATAAGGAALSGPLAPFLDGPGSMLLDGRDPMWSIVGVTADRRPLVVVTHQYRGGPTRLFAVLGEMRPDSPARADPETIFGGFIEPAAPVPVRLRLPDRQGVVVAAEGAVLQYRAGAGAWQAVPGDAALLPHAATQVQVSRKGAGPLVLPLP